MGIDVNYYDEVVYITSPTTSATVQEIYDALRAAEDTPDGLAFGGPVKSITDGFVDGEGEADVGGGFTNPLTITLDANWYIEFWSGVLLGTVADGNVAGGKDSRPVRAEVGSADTVLVLGAERGIVSGSGVTSGDITDIANAVWDDVDAVFMLKVIKNKRALVKNGSTWELIVYDDDDTTPIMNKEIKDKSGNDITDLVAGTLAQELANSV